MILILSNKDIWILIGGLIVIALIIFYTIVYLLGDKGRMDEFIEEKEDENREILERTHVHVGDGMWISKKTMEEGAGEIQTVEVGMGNATTNVPDHIFGLGVDKEGYIVGVDPYTKEGDENKTKVTIGQVVDGVLEYKKREEMEKDLDNDGFFDEIGKEPILVSDREMANSIIKDIVDTREKESDLKEGEEDILELLIKYLKE